MPTVVKVTCPQCKAEGELRFEGLHSGLGPVLYACRVCGAAFASGRCEWPELSAGGRLRYAGVSLLYVAVGALAGGGLGFFVGHAWRDPFFAKQPNGFGDAILPAVITASTIALIQVLRIPRSIIRHTARAGAEPTPHRPSTLLAGGGHTAFAFAVFLLAGLCWLVAVIASRIP